MREGSATLTRRNEANTETIPEADRREPATLRNYAINPFRLLQQKNGQVGRLSSVRKTRKPYNDIVPNFTIFATS